jgi:hypothetical protein
MEATKLYMVLLGCKPEGRFTEQHDIFFGAADALPELVPAIRLFWAGNHKIHIDAWRTVTEVDGYRIELVAKKEPVISNQTHRLFFLNLGGYKEQEFEEYHYKMLVVAKDKGEAIQQAKATAFYRHTGFKGADSHIDDKYGVDVDDIFEIEDILPATVKKTFRIVITNHAGEKDAWHLGYTKLDSLVRT